MRFEVIKQTLDHTEPAHSRSNTGMRFLITILVVAVTLVGVQGKTLETGRQLNNSSSNLLPQSGQQRYKEVILYLTPSQIRALQDGKGLIDPPPVPQPDKHTQRQAYPQNEYFLAPLPPAKPLKTPPVQVPHSDHFVPIIPPPEYRQQGYPNDNIQPQNQQRFLQPIPFFPEPIKEVAINKAKPTPNPELVEPFTNKDDSDQNSRNQLKEQWQNLLEQNRAHFKALASLSQYQSKPENKKNHYLGQNENNINDQKYASDVYNLVRSNNERQLEKQALLEAIANSPPELVHKEINIKHIAGPLVAHVPVPTPFLVPVPEPFEVKIPQPYPVPLEIIRPVPVPIVKTQKIEVDRPVPIEIEKHIPFPVTKNVYVDRPYFVDRLIPVEVPVQNSGSLPVHYHEWHH